MRNAQVMNDFSEIEWGFGCLNVAYKGQHGIRLRAILDKLFPGIAVEIENIFNGWLPHLRIASYITSVSEHRDSEDVTGRLSMWRAYGGDAGVALVLNNTPFLSTSQALGAFTSPVEYLREQEFEDAFSQVVDGIEANQAVIGGMPRADVLGHVFSMFRFAVLCTKHPGFQEELEWRVIFVPNLYSQAKVIHDYANVSGVPQSIYKIPLQDWPDDGFVGLAVPSFLNRLIIGPTRLPGTLFDTFSKVLADAGVADIPNKLFRSDIPLRR